MGDEDARGTVGELSPKGQLAKLVEAGRPTVLGAGPAVEIQRKNRPCIAGRHFQRIAGANDQGQDAAGLNPDAVVVRSVNAGPSEDAEKGDFTHPVVVTTPLSGWFGCAGERGTGIAIALELAKRLASSYPVTVVGATGHELEYYGAKRHLETMAVQPAAVVHVGRNRTQMKTRRV